MSAHHYDLILPKLNFLSIVEEPVFLRECHLHLLDLPVVSIKVIAIDSIIVLQTTSIYKDRTIKLVREMSSCPKRLDVMVSLVKSYCLPLLLVKELYRAGGQRITSECVDEVGVYHYYRN